MRALSPRRLRALAGTLTAALAAIAAFAPGAQAAPACPLGLGSVEDAKPNKLYVYFPPVADPSFPEFGGDGYRTSPAAPFDVRQLAGYTGTDAELRQAITDVVADAFCEFNVKVIPTQAPPPATSLRRVTVAVGTDGTPTGRSSLADLLDFGDAGPVGYGRVWAQTAGSYATVQQWANAIGGAVAHTAGHTYGLTHQAGDVAAPQGSGVRRHLGNDSFATLAATAGLSVQTMHSWELVNPNSAAAHRFRVTFLTTQQSPVVPQAYAGRRSPWGAPQLTRSGRRRFKGKSYHRFRLTWSAGKAWDGPVAGQVAGGDDFQVGATFSGVRAGAPSPVIVTRSELLDGAGRPLRLQPRLPGYDAGTLSKRDGGLDVKFWSGGGRSRLEDVVARELPRVLSIDAMVRGARFVDPFGAPFSAYSGTEHELLQRSPVLRRGQSVAVEVGAMGEGRHVLDAPTQDTCASGDGGSAPDVATCRPAWNAGLFPATTVYLTARVVEPRARRWDRKRRRYVRRPLVSRVHYQLAGLHPDLNRNRVDDAIDVASGRSRDGNADGVPDEAQRRRRPSR